MKTYLKDKYIQFIILASILFMLISATCTCVANAASTTTYLLGRTPISYKVALPTSEACTTETRLGRVILTNC